MNEKVQVIFGLVGDLALFLYGMNSMSDALQKAAGERMKKPQDRITDYISKMFASGNLTETQAEQTAGLLVINNNVDRIADRCQEMNSFIEKMEENGKNFFLEKEDKDKLVSLGGQLGYLDTQMQERTLLLYLEQLELSVSRLRGEIREKCRLSTVLGVMGSLF